MYFVKNTHTRKIMLKSRPISSCFDIDIWVLPEKGVKRSNNRSSSLFSFTCWNLFRLLITDSIRSRQIVTKFNSLRPSDAYICVSKLTIIGSDNGLSPDRHQAIIWTNAGLLLIRPLGTNFSEILIEILTFSFKKIRLKVSSAKRRPFCLGLNVLLLIMIFGNWGRFNQLMPSDAFEIIVSSAMSSMVQVTARLKPYYLNCKSHNKAFFYF